jgi:hypothetical protein
VGGSWWAAGRRWVRRLGLGATQVLVARSAERGGGGVALGQCKHAFAARSERARRGNRRVRALARGECESWAGTGIGASTAQMQAA